MKMNACFMRGWRNRENGVERSSRVGKGAFAAAGGFPRAVVFLRRRGFRGLALLLLSAAAAADSERDGGIRLGAVDGDGAELGAVPLRHSDVEVDVSAHFVRVDVTQYYRNTYDEKIEAVYTFPLGHDAAVDRMSMKVGERLVQGEVKERGAARRIYEAAREQGHVSSLLEQERPNIFTQSVANIEPGAEIEVSIRYVQVLPMIDGDYRFAFPTVVAPRYIPGGPTEGTAGSGSGKNARKGGPFAGPTDEVPDADRITPMPVRPGASAGHSVDFDVRLDSGGPAIRELRSESHEIEVTAGEAPGVKTIELAEDGAVPNRDFRLSWQVRGTMIEEAFLTHTGGYGDYGGGFFSFVLNPPERVSDRMARPRELIFVMDSSGSMSSNKAGDASSIEAAKGILRRSLSAMRPDDRFNVITFNNSTDVLWPEARPNSRPNRERARRYVDQRQGGGGTEMRNAVLRALRDGESADEAADGGRERMRIVLFLTDGLVGNDPAILEAIRENAGRTRVFPVGMSHAPNRYLIDEMARLGRGAADYITPEGDLDAAVERFTERLATPVLTDISLDFAGEAEVLDRLPEPGLVPDLFDVGPIVVHGRYRGSGEGTLTVRGVTGEGAYEREIQVDFPESEPGHDVLATLWAREKVGELTRRGEDRKEEIVELGETFQIMTAHTSFVAVERRRVTLGGEPVQVRVPVEFPKGMSWEGIFGESRPDEAELRSHVRRNPERGIRPEKEADGRIGLGKSNVRLFGVQEKSSRGTGGGHFRARRQATGAAQPANSAAPARAQAAGRQATVNRFATAEVGVARDQSTRGRADASPAAPENGAVFTYRLPGEGAEATGERLKRVLRDVLDPEDGSSFVEVVVDAERGRAHLFVHRSLRPFVENLGADLRKTDGADDGNDLAALWSDFLGELESEIAGMKRRIRLEQRVAPALREEIRQGWDATRAREFIHLVVSVADPGDGVPREWQSFGWKTKAEVPEESFVVGTLRRGQLEAFAQAEGVRSIMEADPRR